MLNVETKTYDKSCEIKENIVPWVDDMLAVDTESQGEITEPRVFNKFNSSRRVIMFRGLFGC
jgi:hypothetical protein